MGWFDFLRGDKRAGGTSKRVRGPQKTADERMKMEQVRFMKWLKTNDPNAYYGMMLKKMGAVPEQRDQFEELEKMVTRLKKMGVIRGANDLDSPSSWIKDAVQGLALVFPMMAQMQRQQPAPVQALAPQPAPQLQAPQQVQQVAPEPEPEEQEVAEEMSDTSKAIIAELEQKSPNQAAAWMVNQSDANVRALVQKLCSTPDEKIPAFLAALEGLAPDYAGAISWLRKRPDYLMQTIRLVRQMQTGEVEQPKKKQSLGV